ncbi:hypothetical protein FGB62_82g070 [Gracilaria domingensis]|nr:hypothetical protein FGB62_82g070 [Gracilaria domingensis]
MWPSVAVVRMTNESERSRKLRRMAFLRSCLEEDEHSEHLTQCAQVADEESPNEVDSQSATIGTQRPRRQAATVARVRWRAAQKSMEDMEEEDTRLGIRTIRRI